MSSEPMQRQQWYVRKGARTHGPFPAEQIAREILLGRIRKKDEISLDGKHWQHPGTLPQLVPEVMKHTDEEQGRQQLLLARLREDERQHERRRAAYAPVDSNRRHGDQRTVESFDVAAHHEPATDEGEKEDRNLVLPAAVIMFALFILATYFLWIARS
jgi:hypothetical protein